MLPLQETVQIVNDSVPSIKEELSMLKTLPFDEFLNQLVSSIIKFSINLAIAIFVFYVGKFIIKKLLRVITTIMLKRKVDRSLLTFVTSLVRIVLYFILIVTVIGIMGVETSSFIAIFGAAGVAIGMALSGTLQNFAGGVLILLLKPYKVGDYIETQGYAGYVTQIQIFHTIINTYDNKSIIIPNGGLSTGSINNWSREDYRRIDWSVSISYGDNVETAREAILAIFASDDRIVKDYIEDDRILRGITDTGRGEGDAEDEETGDGVKKRPWWKKLLFIRHHPAVREHVARVGEKLTGLNGIQLEKVLRKPTVNLDSLGDSSVNLKARAWARSEFYWSVYYDMNERIYNELPKAGISFPFPQLDVHVNQVSDNQSSN